MEAEEEVQSTITVLKRYLWYLINISSHTCGQNAASNKDGKTGHDVIESCNS